MSVCLVYVTAPNVEEARRIGRALVESRLAACANVFDGMRSFYWWEGAVQEDGEAVLIAKTRRDLVASLTDRVVALHSYSCPCVAVVPIEGGHAPFLKWIAAETEDSA